jgi:alkaline phosphatase
MPKSSLLLCLQNRSGKVAIAIGILAVGALTALLALSFRFRIFAAQKRKNVIMLISDGFGPASQTMARNFYTHIHNFTYDSLLPLDKILVGSSRTRSSDSFVTDSAAGATAFSCGIKTYNGAIGVDPYKIPCGTVLEAAKLQGYFTGLVATSRITHATPASFSSHVLFRDYEDDIAVQQLGNYVLGRSVDLMFGGIVFTAAMFI